MIDNCKTGNHILAGTCQNGQLVDCLTQTSKYISVSDEPGGAVKPEVFRLHIVHEWVLFSDQAPLIHEKIPNFPLLASAPASQRPRKCAACAISRTNQDTTSRKFLYFLLTRNHFQSALRLPGSLGCSKLTSRPYQGRHSLISPDVDGQGCRTNKLCLGILFGGFRNLSIGSSRIGLLPLAAGAESSWRWS